MKKLFLLTAAFATMLFASCEKEEVAPTAKESTVTYTVELPSVQTKAGTKAIGDGFNVDQLVYEVWKTEAADERDLKDGAKATRLYQETATMSEIDGEQKCVITLNLVHDQNYTILFWAQNDAADAYDTDLLTEVSYTNDPYLSNNENMAAFYGVAFLKADEIEKSGAMRRVELKRPFAQLNIATMNTVDADEYKVDLNRSKVVVSNVPTVFDVAQNTPTTPAVTDKVEFTFDYAALPQEVLTVNGKAYDHYVAMNYMFAPEGQGNVTVEYWIDATLIPTDVATNSSTPATIYKEVLDVPLKENYRTNIVGNLLTSTTKYEVVIDARWDDVNDPNWDGRVEEVWDEKYVQEPPMVNGAYEISLASELSWLAAQVNAKEGAKKFSGVTFKLVEDIDFNDPNFVGAEELLWNPIGATGRFEGIFDGQNHTISNLKVKTEGKTPAGLFGKVQSGTVKNVKVVNANVQGHYSAAVVVAHGVCAKISNCHVENAIVISTPYNKDEANNIGAIAGFLGADGGSAWVKDCSVKNADITAYRKVGGIVGSANQAAVVTGNTVENVKVTADQTAEYKEFKAADLGAIVGYIHADATVAENSDETEVTLIHKVNSVDEMQNPAAGAQVILSAGEYNIQEDAEFSASIQIIDGDASVYSENNTITTGNDVNYGFITKGENSSLVFDANVNFNGGGFGATDGSQITINGGSVAVNATTTNPRYNIYAVGNGTTVTINDGNFSISKLTLKRAYIYAGAGATVYVKGGTFGKASTSSNYKTGIKGEGNVIITGGTFGFDPTKWLAYGYTTKKEGSNWVVVAPGNNTEEFLANLEYAKPNDVIYVAGSVVLPSKFVTSIPGTLTIEGVSEDAVVSFSSKAGAADGGLNCYADGMDLVFKNIKVVSPQTGSAYSGGFGRAKSVTYDNCEYVGQYRAGSATTTFSNCTIDPQTSYIYTDYANVDFEKCTFKCSEGKGVQVYNDANTSETVINVTDCSFTAAKQGATWDGKPVTAIDINSNGEIFTVNINNTTATGFPEGLVSGETLFNIKGGAENVKVVVDGLEWIRKGAWRDADDNAVVYSSDALQYALDANMNVILGCDIAGNVVATQKADVKIVINGNGKNYNGMITVDGKSATYTTAGLTVKNLTFNATTISGDACIRLGDGTNGTRYTCNVTVDGCTFDVPGAVGVKSYTGGDKNLVITGCTATVNAHSLIQAKGIDNILVEKCTVNSKNGMNFNNSVNVTINGWNADVKGYAARFGEGSATNGAAEVYTIKNSTLKSACEDGDAVIILRGTADNSTLTIESTTLEGTTKITNNAVNAKVIEK